MSDSPSFEAISGLNRLPELLLQRLVTTHAPELAARILDPDALWSARDQLPAALIDAIHRLHEMADEAGYDQLLHCSGGPLFLPDGGTLPTIAIAARTLLDRPAVFNRAHGRRFVEPLRKFREFPGRLIAPPSPVDGAAERAEARFGSFFERRGRSSMCRIRQWKEADNLHFMVSHGQTCRADDAVHEADGACRGTTLVWRPQQHDLVVLDARTGRLRVSAPDVFTLHEYVAGFGQMLFGETTWFGEGAVVTLDPLILSRSDVLRPTRGLIAVKLIELEVGSRCGHLASITLKGADVARYLDESRIDPATHGPLQQAKIRLRTQSDGKWRAVVIGVPDRVTEDWRPDGGVVRRYLEERGFLAGPRAVLASEAA